MSKESTLKNKIALVTGSSRGIGRAIALGLAEDGADIVVTYFRNELAARETAAAIEALGQKALVVQANLAYKKEIGRLFDQIEEGFGRLDIFVHNAALASFKPLLDIPARHWDYMLNVNLSAFFFCSLRAVELMTGTGGCIIGISSLGSRRTFPHYAALGVAKAGLETLARYMATEWRERGINVNVICSGPVATGALEAYQAASLNLNKLRSALADEGALNPVGEPKDLVGVVKFLCSPAAAWIRGQTIVVDGGLSLL